MFVMYKRAFRLSTLSLCLLGLVFTAFGQATSLDRDEIDDRYKWNLTDIYPDWETWEADLQLLEKKMDDFAALRGTLKSGPDALLKASKMNDDLNMLAFKVYRYPQLTRDVDTRNQDASAKLQRVSILFSKFNVATAWLNPELLEIPWPTMKSWLDENPELGPYRFGIEDLYRQQEHVLTEDKEQLLSYFSQFNGTPSTVYSELSTSDIEFPTVTLSDSSQVTMTNGNYSRILATSRNQDDRRLAFENHYGVYRENENTYAAIYNSVCQRDWAAARARNYGSTLEAALEGDNIPVSVYENLISTVKANTDPLKKYINLRKKVLGLDAYHLYDGFIGLVDLDKTYPYEEANEWVLASVKPLGDAYQEKMSLALKGGWIDVFENTGKRPGAYSANVYGVHPYMLLNYNETLDNVFTLAHELGHTMHTTLSNENQPFATHGYTIFVAEVASTLNERLLLDYMLENTSDPKERITLLQQSIDNIVGTFYAQVMFADYELQVHRLVEQGQPITPSTLNGIFRDLYTTYYGDELVFDELYEVIWARIPHFYRVPYYVYQYATCFASSAQLYENMKNGSEEERRQALDKYLELLKSGGNDYPMEQLKKAGVNLTQKEPIQAITQQMNAMVDQLQEELAKLN
jgi:oligoendopeptidase F